MRINKELAAQAYRFGAYISKEQCDRSGRTVVQAQATESEQHETIL